MSVDGSSSFCSASHSQRQIAIFGAGDVFGLNSVREASVVCQQHSSELLMIPFLAYEELLKSKPTGGIEEITSIFRKGCA